MYDQVNNYHMRLLSNLKKNTLEIVNKILGTSKMLNSY